MMKKRAERLRGMYDLLPEAYQRQQWTLERLGTFLEQAGYAAVDAPLLEQSDLFQASFGQEAWQHLYAFRLHHRELCLRPEYTASICRLYLDHYQQQPLPLRLRYAGPIFRYEAPGRGRYRQHTQLGVELFGGHPASADTELLQLACDLLHEVGIQQYRLELGHIGVASGFIQRLHLDAQAAHLLLSLMEQISRSEDGERRAQARLEALYPNSASEDQALRLEGAAPQAATDEQARLLASLLTPLSSAFDDEATRQEVVDRFLWKVGRGEQRRQILDALEFLKALHGIAGPAPMVFEELRTLLARYELDAAPLEELEHLVELLVQGGVPREQIILNLALGRGVSYYTGLLFEVHALDADGFDAQLCGGGRYDQLVRTVGGSRDVRACGFAFGLERLLPLISAIKFPIAVRTELLVIPVNFEDLGAALELARGLRRKQAGLIVEVDVSGNGVGAGLKLAARRAIPLALIIGEDERRAGTVTLRHLTDGSEYAVPLDELDVALERARISGREWTNL